MGETQTTLEVPRKPSVSSPGSRNRRISFDAAIERSQQVSEPTTSFGHYIFPSDATSSSANRVTERVSGAFKATHVFTEDEVLLSGLKPVGAVLCATGKNINPDQYESIEEVQEALFRAGLKSSSLIVGIDFTRSNTENGEYTYDGHSLHQLYNNDHRLNPYQEVIKTIGKTLARFDDDGLIPVYGFGDATCKDKGVFSLVRLFEERDRPCNGFEEVLAIYRKVLGIIQLDGPTSFAPIIRKAIEIVKVQKKYHILLIITDGCTLTDSLDKATIMEASEYPLSIIIVGVGDGPWGQVKLMDDLPDRSFDNVQFVNYEKIRKCGGVYKDSVFVATALQEIPPQYTAICKLGLLSKLH
eukprot:CAMPEP_0184649346 /NCGR_PEP_ID=MMETSP0308-20130426/6683_1 /TAXON_ID=38269 /ORGANISM="Gloeochaete witrockiana, Strain SAG 46.84" /LENGTH=355 /DNA_ID=CAMNT_0027081987 /DNA_START=214 /DNA_END=1281 /DNA_ORIENTATION=-